MTKKTWHIHVQGRVQGVGFRPFVYRIAQQKKLKGEVSNTLDGVHIFLNTTEQIAHALLSEIVDTPPPLAVITSASVTESPHIQFAQFSIAASTTDTLAGKLHLTPDIAMCEACRGEIRQSTDRRYQYAFTTCTNCGPRYSIMRALPYDRPNTSMAPFAMCAECNTEYNDPLERRHYSQTNSCHDCGLTITTSDKPGERLDLSNALAVITRAWDAGKTVAIKGIGGYLLTCDANNEAAISTLRDRKHRPTKPFALMFPEPRSIERSLVVSENAMEELTGISHPIVLLRAHDGTRSAICMDAVAPGLDKLGVMLPYTPLFQLLMDEYGSPIVATSGNISNAPIVFDRHRADEMLRSVADLVIHDNRDIETPQDDSVLTFSPRHRQRVILRRSRGMAPAYLPDENQFLPSNALATGAMLKSAFAISQSGVINISQYLGDLDNYDTQVSYEHALEHMIALVDASPDLILTDLHPNYASTRIGLALAEKWNIPVETVQHHEAHFAAIIGEHWRQLSEKEVLGVIWDGTGLGDDGHIWGGEFFQYSEWSFERVGHFKYFPMPLGDKVTREPRLSALMIAGEIDEYRSRLKGKFGEEEWKVYSTLLEQQAPIMSSSAGRLFDAAASILGLADIQSYEGEAAMLLEELATKRLLKSDMPLSDHYRVDITDDGIADFTPLLTAMSADLTVGTDKDCIALKFHISLAYLIKSYALRSKMSVIAFSGGVFQNSLLTDLIIDVLGSDFELYFHNKLSPNDENIAFGQLTMNHIRSMRP